ncbi:unnamed protein product [Cunninghamella blakesleeana]
MHSDDCHLLVLTNSVTSDSSYSLLHTVFHNVLYISTDKDIIQECQNIQQTNSFIFIIIDEECYSEIALYQLLYSILQAVQTENINQTAAIVYSSRNSSEFMLKCLEHGAVDFILKPFHQSIVNTMFLNFRRTHRQLSQGIHQTHFTAADRIVTNPVGNTGNQDEIWSLFQERIQSLYDVDNSNLLNQSITEYFTPKSIISLSTLKPILSDRDTELRSSICSWNFAPFDYSTDELIQCAFIIIKYILDLPDLEYITVKDNDLYKFLIDVANMYHSLNPYHNFRHAVDVMQAIFYFLCQMGVIPPPTTSTIINPMTCGNYSWLKDENKMKDLIKPLDALALVLASIGHDVGHPGVNNVFMVKTSTPLAILYNDQSVLESFHSMMFYNLLRRHCFQSFTFWRTKEECTWFRKIIVKSILATDMGLHNDYVLKIQDQKTRLDKHPVDLDNRDQKENELITIYGALIKCADISNCARPFPIAKRWAEILAEEFYEQGDLEKELGLDVAPINERKKVSMEDFQLGFKEKIAFTLFKSVANVLPDMNFMPDTLENNCKIWANKKKHCHDSGVGDEICTIDKSTQDHFSDHLDSDHCSNIKNQSQSTLPSSQLQQQEEGQEQRYEENVQDEYQQQHQNQQEPIYTTILKKKSKQNSENSPSCHCTIL